MTVEEEYYNVYLPQKWKQDDIVRNIRNKITSEEYEFIGKLYMCKAIGEIKAEIEEELSKGNHSWYKAGMEFCLEIINKHTEGEEE